MSSSLNPVYFSITNLGDDLYKTRNVFCTVFARISDLSFEVLKLSLKYGVSMWTGYVYLRTGTNADSFEHSNDPSGYIKTVTKC
jgi:hypothetical protein